MKIMKKYDIAAYIWPSYTNKEPRSHIFWPNGVGEWQTVQMVHERKTARIIGKESLFGVT